MNPSSFIEQVIGDLRQRKLAVFCGAGVSLRSGVPIVGPLVLKILNSLGTERSIYDKISTSSIPFEAFIETIAKEVSITRLLDVFDADCPNSTHHLIARLAVQGAIDTIVTTNFDELFERSLDMAGLSKGRDYVVAAAANEFSRLDWTERRTKVVKLHGTIGDKERLGITLSAIAAGSGLDQISEVIRQLFLNTGYRSVLILGYSCSDIFDITPAIESCAPSPMRILFLDHSYSRPWQAALVEPVRVKQVKNPFHDYEGERLVAETGQVIGQLWSTFFIGEEEPRDDSTTSRRWEYIVDEWAGKTRAEHGDSVRHWITSSLLMHIDEYKLAREEVEKALKVSDSDELLSRLAYSYQVEGELQKAAALYARAADASRSQKDLTGFLQHGGLLAEVTRQLGRPKEAIHLLEENQKILQRVATDFPEVKTVAMSFWPYLQSRQLVYLGNAYYDLGRTDDAVRCFEQARDIAVSIGDKIGEANSLGSLGRALRLQGREDEAENVDQQGRRIGQHIGSPELARKLTANIIDARTHATTNEHEGGAMAKFDTTNHEILRSQSELLLEFMELFERISVLSKDERAKRFALFQDRELTCWECGHVFPLFQGLAAPPNILVCPKCQSPLAGFESRNSEQSGGNKAS
jgi:tetratricopeptide (TPR) repeat protein/NAD-dependent SIR2 family protein deacetylase